jgi:hypothetical protein
MDGIAEGVAVDVNPICTLTQADKESARRQAERRMDLKNNPDRIEHLRYRKGRSSTCICAPERGDAAIMQTTAIGSIKFRQKLSIRLYRDLLRNTF